MSVRQSNFTMRPPPVAATEGRPPPSALRALCVTFTSTLVHYFHKQLLFK